MLDLRQLAALRAVSVDGSIARAAVTLGWSQPTVAHHLRRLEKLLGAPAVVSTASGTRITPLGANLLSHAEAILERADRAVAQAQEFLESQRTTITLGVFPSAGARLLPDVVREVRRAGFDVTVREAEVESLLSDAEAMRLDAAIIYSHPKHMPHTRPGMRRHRLFTERLSLIVANDHPLAGSAAVGLDAFRDDDWILGMSIHDPVEAALLAAAEAKGFTPRAAVRSDDYAVVAGYVAAGFGVALVPELALPLHADTVKFVGLTDTDLVREIALLTSTTLDARARAAILGALTSLE